jgi:hypothetical protein
MLMLGGSGKRSLRSLPLVLPFARQAIGKLRLPLPPIVLHFDKGHVTPVILLPGLTAASAFRTR